MHGRETETGPVEVPTLEVEEETEFDWGQDSGVAGLRTYEGGAQVHECRTCEVWYGRPAPVARGAELPLRSLPGAGGDRRTSVRHQLRC